MSKRKADIEDMQKQMRSLRKKLKKLTRAATEEVTRPHTATEEVRDPRGVTAEIVKTQVACNTGTQINTEDKENGEGRTNPAATSEETSIVDEVESEARSDSSTSGDGTDTEQESKTDVENTVDSAAESASLSNETRERLGLKAKPAQSDNIVLHPILTAEWNTWMRKGLYEGDEEDEKRREEEENKLREEITKKFPRKGGLYAEAPKLNQEILAYMSSTAKSRDKHFVSAQNALGSAIIAVAKTISLILELEEGDISSRLMHLLGNAGKLLAGLHYQHSIMRRAFILPGIDEKYRELLKKQSEITGDLFGEDLFKKLKHTKSLDKVVEDLAPRQHSKKPLKTANWGNRKSLPTRPRGRSQQARTEARRNPCASRTARGIINGTSMRPRDQHDRTIMLARSEKGSWPVKVFYPRMGISNEK
ncbi:PREDICTED: uncharacterized protein LOC105570127 [Vollenhovia emeryi]|uniref:uncharacterized protein LOC105570127 n=1 Tax=Vollenhovia emeryi TaxID=411798 RepID=UPI0005F42215|nr:PREDICTED: uncharacterized protein LOC105570127 [Vollenhovia emeryi]